MGGDRWHERIRRTAELSNREQSARDVLAFYRRILEFQQQIYDDVQSDAPQKQPPRRSLREQMDAARAGKWMAGLLAIVEAHGPGKLAAEARRIRIHDSVLPESWLAEFLHGPGENGESVSVFLARTLLQPYAESLAVRCIVPIASSSCECPLCGSKPQFAVLHPEGDGGKRYLACSLCYSQWEFRRVLCPACGEVEHTKLPRYSSEQAIAVRIEACDTCKSYLKSFDMTVDGLQVPEVEEIATPALDVWAAEEGYRKIQLNLLGF